ncbi:uncharacterized protein LOC127855131 [Dreissena polymorpha]|nr:uncharacterized protein LOC127855131 [Dreissena polymorpha]
MIRVVQKDFRWHPSWGIDAGAVMHYTKNIPPRHLANNAFYSPIFTQYPRENFRSLGSTFAPGITEGHNWVFAYVSNTSQRWESFSTAYYSNTDLRCNLTTTRTVVSDPDSKLVSMRVSSSLHSGDIYQVVPALFGYDLFTRPSVSGKLRQATPFDMCTPPEVPLDERIAVVYRRKACTFSKQALNVQSAGGKGVIIIDYGYAPLVNMTIPRFMAALSGVDTNQIHIPVVFMGQHDGIHFLDVMWVDPELIIVLESNHVTSGTCPYATVVVDPLGVQYSPPGSYLVEGTIELCPPGTYQPEPNWPRCHPCPMGYFCATSGLTAVSGKCGATYSCRHGASDPNAPCGFGNICPDGYQQPCGNGYYQDNPRGHYCTLCRPSFYCPLELNLWENACQSGRCPTGGSYRFDQSKGQGNCLRGYYGVNGTCKICPKGHACDVDGTLTPQLCEPGWDCGEGEISVTPKVCPLGHYCDHRVQYGKEINIWQFKPEYYSSSANDIRATNSRWLGPPNLTVYTRHRAHTSAFYMSLPIKLRSRMVLQTSNLVIKNATYEDSGIYWFMLGSIMTHAYNVKITTEGTRGGSRIPCPVGHYQDLIKSIECKKCPIGTLCNSTGIIYPMVKCSGYVCQQGEVALCQQYCPHGYETTCPDGTIPSNFTHCAPCPEAKLCYNNQVLPCPPDNYCVGGKQFICLPGRRCVDGKLSYCQAGHYAVTTNGTTVCAPCPVNKVCPHKVWEPLHCVSEFHLCSQGTSRIYQEACPLGYKCNVSLESGKQACEIGEYGKFHGICVTCPAGRFCDVIALVTPHVCPAGYYCPTGTVTPAVCPASYYCPTGTVTPAVCPAGYYCPTGTGTPTVCPEGYFCPSGTVTPNACPAGFYCPTGTLTPNVCPASYYCPTGTSTPGTCPAGYYCPTGTVTPAVCPASYYCPTGTVTPAVCPAGYYCPTGTGTPTVCPEGYYCPTGTVTPNACPAGFYCPTGTLTPKICPASYYCPTGSIAPVFCPAGYYCPTGTSTPGFCPAGYYCPLGTGTPHVCPHGYYCPTGTVTELPCVPGHLCPKGSGKPVPCPLGTYVPNIMSTECSLCAEGYFCPNTYTEIECVWHIYCKPGSIREECEVTDLGNISSSLKIRCIPGCQQYMTEIVPLEFTVLSQNTLKIMQYSWTLHECRSLDLKDCRYCQHHTIDVGHLYSVAVDKQALTISWAYALVYITVSYENGYKESAHLMWKYFEKRTNKECYTVPTSGITLIHRFDIYCRDTNEGNENNESLDMTTAQFTYNLMTMFEFQEILINVADSHDQTDLYLMAGNSSRGHILDLHMICLYQDHQVWDLWFTTQVFEPKLLTTNMIHEMEDVATTVSFEGEDFYSSLQKVTSVVHMMNLEVEVVNTTTITTTEDGEMTINEQKTTTQLRSMVVERLSEIAPDNADMVKGLSHSLNTAISKKDDVTKETQKKAMDMYVSLVNSYEDTTSDVPQQAVKDIAKVLVTGTVMMMDFTENEKNKSLVKESSAALINLMDNIMGTLQNKHVTNSPGLDIVTPEATIQVSKVSPDRIAGNMFGPSAESSEKYTDTTEVTKSGLSLPKNVDLTEVSNGSVAMQYMHMKKNPFNWGKNTEWVLTPVQSLSLKDEQNKPIPMSNLTEPVRITTPIASKGLPKSIAIPIRFSILKRNTTWTLFPKMSHSCYGTFNLYLEKNSLVSFIFTLPGKVKSINLGIGKNRLVDKSHMHDKSFKYPEDIVIIDKLYGWHSDEDVTAEFENTTLFRGVFQFKTFTFFCTSYLGRCCSSNVSECLEIYSYCYGRGLVNVSSECLAKYQEIIIGSEVERTQSDQDMNDTQSDKKAIKQILLRMYDSDVMLNKTGSYLHIGVSLDIALAEVRDILTEENPECLGNPEKPLCLAEVEMSIPVSVNSLVCLYWDEDNEEWTPKRVQVAFSNADDTSYECLSTHLSAFAGTIFVAPTSVDPFGEAELFLTFFENPVVVTTVILVWVMYIFFVHWARNADRRDLERVGVVNCKDNLQSEKYLYLVCIATGWWKHAGTTANVYFYMTGSEGVSGRKCLSSAGRKCFQAGFEDWFLVTTSQCLGEIQSVTLWHDNTGNNPQWYLNQVYTRDVQTGNSWTFIYNDWLAVDRGALLQIATTLGAVTREEARLKTKYHFMIKSSKDLRDGNLWFSIFSKPPQSQFTRVQRLTCTLSLLLTTMLTNLMFYGIPNDDPADQVVAGAFKFSLSQIVIGIQSSLIMFPINLISIQLFMKVKPKPRKSSRKPSIASEDIKTIIDSCGVNIKRIFNHLSIQNPAGLLTFIKEMQNYSNIRLFHDMFREVKGFECGLDPNLIVTEFVNTVDMFDWELAGKSIGMNVQVDDSGSFSLSAPSAGHTEVADSLQPFGSLPPSFLNKDHKVCHRQDRVHRNKKRTPTVSFAPELMMPMDDMTSGVHSGTVIHAPVSIRKDTSRILPWWFIYIAWFVAISTCLISSYFTMLYGLKFGYARSVEWLVSFFTGLVQSIFFQQPIKVLFMAVLLTLIFKKPAEFDDVEEPRELDDDEEYLKAVTEDPDVHHNLRPPLPAHLLKAIRERLGLEWIIDVAIRNIIIHFVYLSIVILAITGHKNVSTCYETSLSVRKMFDDNNLGFQQEDVSTREDVYSYLHKTVVPLMSKMSDTAERELSMASEFFLVGGYRLRQARISKGECGPIFIEGLPRGCQPSYSMFIEDRNRYNMSWENLIDPVNNATSSNLTASIGPWSFQSAWSLKTLPFAGVIDTYSGGGFVLEVGAREDPTDKITGLAKNGWIDDYTRAVFLEFTLYNANVDIFTVAIYLFEFTNRGSIHTSNHEFSTRLYYYSSSYEVFTTACEVIFVIFNILFVYFEIKKYKTLGKSHYFSDFWTVVQLGQIALAFSLLGVFVHRTLTVASVMAGFEAPNKTYFINFYGALFWDYVLTYVMAALVTVVIMQTVKFLSFNRKILIVAETLHFMKGTLLAYALIFGIVTVGFASMAYMLFNSFSSSYSSFNSAWNTNMLLLLGDSGIYELLYEASPILGPAFIVTFAMILQYGIITFVQAIINMGRNVTNARRNRMKNRLEIINYVSGKLKTILDIK